jgi:hypothetical protein
MATVVVFEKNGVRILEGVDERDYRGRGDVAINPVFPRGIPPHKWKFVNGKIELPVPPQPDLGQVILAPKPKGLKKLINFILRRK